MKVSIKLNKSQTADEAEELLFKALNSQRTGETHTEKFLDDAMQDLAETMNAKHEELFEEMISEISALLDSEYE